jgi:hypothetical protein
MDCQILSIDAWREPEGGWTWNMWYHAGKYFDLKDDENNRTILRKMRESGHLSEESKGKVAVEDDGYNIVIKRKSNQMPLFAIVYGDQI